MKSEKAKKEKTPTWAIFRHGKKEKKSPPWFRRVGMPLGALDSFSPPERRWLAKYLGPKEAQED